jgi:heme-degrading monooxygenase HmoA
MHVVIFEVEPKDGRRETYFEMASALRAELERIEGFISVERFESLVTPGKILSLSTWEDEAAIQRWRDHVHHHDAQTRGRETMFERYRIRVAEVARDYDKTTSPWRS